MVMVKVDFLGSLIKMGELSISNSPRDYCEALIVADDVRDD